MYVSIYAYIFFILIAKISFKINYDMKNSFNFRYLRHPLCNIVCINKKYIVQLLSL